MKKVLATLAVVAMVSSVSLASFAQTATPVKELTRKPAVERTIKKQHKTELKEVKTHKGVKTGGAAPMKEPVKKHKRHSKKK